MKPPSLHSKERASACLTGQLSRIFRLMLPWLAVVLLVAFSGAARATITQAKIVAFDCSHRHTLALTDDGKVLAWGHNASGELGDGTTVDRSTPVQVQGLPTNSPIVQVSAGWSHSMALTEDGRVFCWGSNFGGQLGDGTRTRRSLPYHVTTTLSGQSPVTQGPALPLVKRIDAYYGSLAITTTGDVYGWGANTNGALGIGVSGFTHISTGYDRVRPVKMTVVSDNSPVVDVAGGVDFSLVLCQDGSVFVTGSGYHGQLGNGTSGVNSRTATPLKLTTLSSAGIVNVEAAKDTCYALTSAGRVYSWGSGNYGQLNLANTWRGDTTTPSLIPAANASNVVELVAGENHVLVRTSTGKVRGWGYNGWSQLNNSEDNHYTAVDLPALDGAVILAAGETNSQWLDSEGTLRGFGSTIYGQLGNGTFIRRDTPGKVPGLSGVADVAAGEDVSYALLTDRRVVAWGSNSAGQLGDGSMVNRAAPQVIPDLKNIVGLSAGLANESESNMLLPPDNKVYKTIHLHRHVLAVDTSGKVWAWGSNGCGQLGDGTTTNRLKPVAISIPGKVLKVAAGGSHSLALTDTGKVYAWGYNNLGQIGNGVAATETRQLTPLLVAQLPTAVDIAAGATHSVARTATGDIYSWGGNNRGQVGHGVGDFLPVPRPTKTIQTISSVAWSGQAISAGAGHTMAVTANDRIVAWGENGGNQILPGNLTRYISPVESPFMEDGSPAAVDIVAGGVWHTVALTYSGKVFMWGSDYLGEYFTNDSYYPFPPTRVDLPGQMASVAAGRSHSLALAKDGTVYAWGNVTVGALGFEMPRKATEPVISVMEDPPPVVLLPETYIFVTPGATSSSATATFTMTSERATGYEYRLDGSAWKACGATVTLQGLKEGGHLFEVVATGAGGLKDATPAKHSWKISNTPPPPPSPLPVLKVTGKTKVTTTKNSVKIRGTVRNATKVEYRIGKGAYKKAKLSATSWNIPLKKLKVGKTTLQIRATGAGGVSKVVKVTVTRKKVVKK